MDLLMVKTTPENVQEAKKLFEQLYGGPRAVPYIPKVVAS